MKISTTLSNKLKETNIEPRLVFEIDGINNLYTTGGVKVIPRYGDEDLYYGNNDGLVYGGYRLLNNQKPIITLDGTTTKIIQNLSPDKARGTGITTMSVVLVDINGEATKIASGGYNEILFRRCKVWVGFGDNISFPQDYILIMRGIIDSFQALQGKVKFNLSSPDQKRRSLVFPKGDTTLDGAIDASQTNIDLASVTNFFVVPDHPGYSPKDTSVKSYVKIEDEIIEYSDISGNTLVGCARGQLNTVAASHADDTQAETFFKLEGNSMDLALKLMLSDVDQTSYLDNFPAMAVNTFYSEYVANSIFFNGIDLTRQDNVRTGDYVKTSGFTNGANNLSSWTEITNVVTIDTGTYIVLDATLADEAMTSGVVEFLSQYNTLGKAGIGLYPDEVDITKHDFLRRNFLFNFDYRFYIKEDIEELKEFIESELYRPAGCYSLPSDKDGLSRISVGLHAPPLPNESIVVLSRENITKPDVISIDRSVNKNFYNAILVKYNDSPLDDKLTRKVFTIPGTNYLPDYKGNRPLVIESLGMRDDLSGASLSASVSSKLLNRYQAAAEHITKLDILFSAAVQINVGDIIILDPTDLNILNPSGQNRNREKGLWEVVNKELDIKGMARVDLTNTSFNLSVRYGLISATSRVRTVISQSKFVIESPLAYPKYGSDAEYRKWENLAGVAVKIRSSNWSDVFETNITNVSLNTITLADMVPFTIVSGMLMELSNYDFVNITSEQKLIYAHFSDDDNNFPSDSGLAYRLI